MTAKGSPLKVARRSAAGFPPRSGGLLWGAFPPIGLAWMLLAALGGLLPQAAHATFPAAPPFVQCKAQQGPVQVTALLAPKKAALSDLVTLELRIEFEKGVSLPKPNLDALLADFVIRDVHEPLPRSEGQRRVLQYRYVLEPLSIGALSVGPIGVSFRDDRQGTSEDQRFEVGPLEVTVSTLVDSEESSLALLRPLATGVDPPVARGVVASSLLGGTAVLFGLGFLGWRWRARRRTGPVEVRSPQELARLELGQILREDLAERDIKLFYVELIEVIRRYLERSQQVHGCEQTTEEFLRAVTEKRALAADQTRRLQLLLEAADRVKFAAYQPGPEDLEASIDGARHVLGLIVREAAA